MGLFDAILDINPQFAPVFNTKGMIYDKLERYS